MTFSHQSHFLGIIAGVGLAFPTTSVADEIFSEAVIRDLGGTVVMYDGSGGALTRARLATIDKNFTDRTGVEVRPDFNPDETKFVAAMEGGHDIPWSLVEIDPGAFARLRDAGHFEKLDPSIIDFERIEESAFDEYGVKVLRYGIVLTYNTEVFSGSIVPTSMRDLYDMERFPGKRCLYKSPLLSGVLESALLSSGTDRDSLYPMDLDKAFGQLDLIRDQIIWYNNGDDAIRMLTQGDCSIGIAWSGRVFNSATRDGAPLAVAWQDSLYSQAVYAVPKGAPNPKAGQAMIANYVADSEGQKALVREIGYASALVGLQPSDYGEEVEPWIVAGANADAAIEMDSSYYATHLEELHERFNLWVSLN